MEVIRIPSETEIKKWMFEALEDYFSRYPITVAKPSVEQDDFLNRKQIASILNISMTTLHKWCKQGLPRHQQHGRVYFIKSEVFKYLKENKPFGKKKYEARVEMFDKLQKAS